MMCSSSVAMLVAKGPKNLSSAPNIYIGHTCAP